jgi:hypothetical protein
MGKKNALPEPKSVVKKQAAAESASPKWKRREYESKLRELHGPGDHNHAPLDTRAFLIPRQAMPGRASC